jgi:hypothetical protein
VVVTRVISHNSPAEIASRLIATKPTVVPSPPQLATDGVEDDPEGYSFWVTSHGIRWTGMPSWKATLTDEQIWTLALFLKHMDRLPPAPQQAWQSVPDRPGARPLSLIPLLLPEKNSGEAAVSRRIAHFQQSTAAK